MRIILCRLTQLIAIFAARKGMSYKTYTTDAIVCGTYDRRTADRSYRLFTRELGMVWADARSVRLEKSKQRQALCDFALVRVSLVRGKGGWKVGSVAAHRNFYYDAADQAARGSVVTIVRLLRRFVQGEEAQTELFDFVVASLVVATGSLVHRAWFDQCVAARCFVLLGYVAADALPSGIGQLDPDTLDQQHSATAQTEIATLLQNAETVSHL